MTQPALTLLGSLLAQRRWNDFTTFQERYAEAAHHLAATEGPPRIASATIGRRQFNRWVAGDLKSQPRREQRRVLHFLFPGISMERLLRPLASEGGSSLEKSQTADSPVEGHGTSTGDVVMAAAHESADFMARAEGSNVGPHTIEQLEGDIRRIVREYPTRPIGPLFSEVRHLRTRAFELLEGRQPPGQTRDLYLAAGVLCGVLANASFDLGHYDAAETQARVAHMCAELADHHGLRAWVRGVQGLIAYWDGRPRDAVRFAEAGISAAPARGTAPIRLASIQARAHGQLNQRQDALTSLHRAEALREQFSEDDTLPRGMMDFPTAKQILYGSSTHLWLGGPHIADAEALASESVARYESDPPEKRRLGELSLARLDLATAQLHQGELEGAADQVHLVLDAAGRRRTESVLRGLGRINRHLELPAVANAPAAVGLREAIIAHLEHGPAELPPGGHQ